MERVDGMKCRNYNTCGGKTRSPQNKVCWQEWRLCGFCAVKEHPESYSTSFIRNRLSLEKKMSKVRGTAYLQRQPKTVAFFGDPD